MTRPSEREELQALQHALDRRVAGQVGFDSVSRILYSTDASNHQVEPIGVVTPRSDEGLQAALEVAREFGVTVVARGAGTGLAGQAIGRGLIVDTSRHLRRILNIDQEARTVTVEPGAVLATVNQALAPHGLMVGPDPASADRATVGGMIGTNASGAHSICYGMTADHLVAAEVYLSDGPMARLDSLPLEEAVRRSQEGAGLGRILTACLVVRQRYAAQIAERWPHTWRRASGYGLNYLNGYMPASPPSWDGQAQPYARPDQVNLCGLLCGSEGTLAVVRNASLRVVPRPGATVLVVLSYGSVTDACDEAPNMLSACPASVELIPQSLLHRAQGIPAYARRLSFVEGDPAALLVVEFTGASMAEALSAGQRLGSAGRMLAEPAAQADLWAVRKVGLGLLMSVAGDTKPVEFIEDVAVPVERLGEYTRRVDEILREHGTFGEWYAHASAGCLHMRPMLNLKSVEGVRAMASIGRAVAQVALDMHGSLSGEHGDGLSRTQYNELLFGPDLMQAFREVKQAFDPAGLLNPGKVIPESRGPTAPDRPASLRYAPGYKVTPVATVMAFRREGDFAHAVELCNGAGVCLKTTGVMCPSFQATRDEAASTRGRANVLRAAMSGLLATEGRQPGKCFKSLTCAWSARAVRQNAHRQSTWPG